MRNILAILAVAILALAVSAFAVDPTIGSQESGTWYWDVDLQEWVEHATLPIEEVNARLFRGGDEITGNCNKKYWEVPVYVHASVAQWIDFSLDWNQFDWYIRKPGIYAGNSIEACVASNSDIYIDYEGFDNLMPDDPTVGTGNPISVWYGLEIGLETPLTTGEWVAAPDLNGDDDTIEDCEKLHYSLCWKLWNKIEVIECNSACEYSDDATITLTLLNQKTWIDDDGTWWDLVPMEIINP